MMRPQAREVHGEEVDTILFFQPMTILCYFEEKWNKKKVIVAAELL